MLNQNKPEEPVVIVNGLIIYHSLDQQLVRKSRKKKKGGWGGRRKKTVVLRSDFMPSKSCMIYSHMDVNSLLISAELSRSCLAYPKHLRTRF